MTAEYIHMVTMTLEKSIPLKVRLKRDDIHLNMPDLLPDELAYSYLIRLCLNNGIRSLHDLVKMLKYGTLGRYCSDARLDAMNVPLDDYFIIANGESLFEKSSTVASLRLLFTKDMALHDISNIKNQKDDSFMEPLRVCPECLKEDLRKYGVGYYHRIHHMPGISICPYHDCALFEYSWDKNKAEDIYEEGDRITDIGTQCKELPYAKEYAEFIYGLLFHSNVSRRLCSSDTISLIKKRLNYIGNLPGEEPTEEELLLYSHGRQYDFARLLRSKNIINAGAVLFTLFRLFGTFEEFESDAIGYLAEREMKEDAEKLVASIPGYRLLETESRNGLRYMKLEHEECKGTFWRGFSEFSTRTAECPVCREKARTPEGFRSSFETEFGDVFSLENEYADSKTAIVVRLNGTDISMKDRPGKMLNRLRWLMKDDNEMTRLKTTGVVRDLVNQKSMMALFIRNHFRKDEPFLTSSLPPNPDMNIIVKTLCDKGDIHRIANGLYSRTPITMTPDQIIDFRYIRSGSETYGYDIGDRFLEDVIPGYVGDHSVRHIVTNPDRDVLYHRLEVVIGGIICNIYRSETHINDSNRLVLALIGFFRHEDACTCSITESVYHQLAVWAVRNGITIDQICRYSALCTDRTQKRVKELMKEVKGLCQEDQ